MRVDFRLFRGSWTTWDALFAEAAEFATRLGPARLISISHSEDNTDGVVTVWYWTSEPESGAYAQAVAEAQELL